MTISLKAEHRKLVGKKVNQVRQAGEIPAVLYGHQTDNLNLKINRLDFEKIFVKAGESTIIDLIIGQEAPKKVLIADVWYHPVKQQVFHIDFKQIRMDEKLTAHVGLNFVGESLAVKEKDGVFVHNINELEIRCLPGDLIHQVEVDISRLKTFDDIITVADLNIPKNIEIIGHEPEDVVATVARPREEEPEPAPVEEEAAEGEEAPAKGESPADDKEKPDKAKAEEKENSNQEGK